MNLLLIAQEIASKMIPQDSTVCQHKPSKRMHACYYRTCDWAVPQHLLELRQQTLTESGEIKQIPIKFCALPITLYCTSTCTCTRVTYMYMYKHILYTKSETCDNKRYLKFCELMEQYLNPAYV